MNLLAEVKYYGPTTHKGSRWRVKLPPAVLGESPITKWVPRRQEHPVSYDVWRAVLEACIGTRWRPRSYMIDEFTVHTGPDPDVYYVSLQAQDD